MNTEEQVLRKPPYIKREWCERALQDPVRREVPIQCARPKWIRIPGTGRYSRCGRGLKESGDDQSCGLNTAVLIFP